MRRPAGERQSAGRTAVAAVVVATILTGCSRADDGGALDGDVPTTEATSSTTTTTQPTTTTTEPECPAVEPTISSDGLAERDADVDGDGRVDLVQSFPTSAKTTTVTLLVDLAVGGGATIELDSEHTFPTALLGTAVVERLDHRELLFVRVGAGASTVTVGIYWYDECRLRPVTNVSGDPVELPIGGSVGSVSGAECGSLLDPEADLLVREGRLVEGDEYEVTTTEYRYDAGVLTASPETEATVARTTDASKAAELSCGDLSL